MPKVFANLLAKGFLAENVLIVDNGSTDSTKQVASQLGAKVFEERRRGYGRALWRALEELPEEAEWLFFTDGDGNLGYSTETRSK